MDTSDASKAASPAAEAKAESKPKTRRTPNRRSPRKAARGESSEAPPPAASEERPTAAPETVEKATPPASAPVQENPPAATGNESQSAKAPEAERSVPETGDRGDRGGPRSEGNGNGYRIRPEQRGDDSSFRGDDRRGHGFGQQGGFRKKGKKGKKGRGGGGGGGPRNETPGWIQPLPPDDLVQLYGDLPDPSHYVSLEEMSARAAEIEASGGDPVFLDQVDALNLGELTAFVQGRGIKVEGRPSRRQLLRDLFNQVRESRTPLIDRGHLDLSPEGHGFIVHSSNNYRLLPESSFLSSAFIRSFGLKRGHEIEALVKPPEEAERCPAVLKIKSAMGRDPSTVADIAPFEDLIPFYPTERILLEVVSEKPAKEVSMRVFDILTPIGFGQRGLIVAPPRTGKTILLQGIANAVAINSPNARLIVLLIDERPEEVTDFRRNVRGEVVSSTFDESPESHVHAAEMVISKARRLIEIGEHVVILLDSITRLARAYNALASNSGKIMSGGLEATALQKPKRFFGAARNIEGGGSLTIMASALVDTGSRMDEVIFEEFKGTGNMEVHLDRDLVNKRIFPSINVERSGTRKEELLYHPEELSRIYALRRIMQGVPPSEAMEMLITRLRKTRTNAEFLMSLNR
ncbi:MAG: transcription termination factor Rho [Opitutaceae bacterium]